MTDNTCNGWTNYETWQAALWLSEGDFLGRCQGCGIDEVISGMIDDELYELANGDEMQGLALDIYNGWLSSVNLNEIADNFNRDLEREQ